MVTKKELKAKLDSMGIEYPTNATISELNNLLDSNSSGDNETDISEKNNKIEEYIGQKISTNDIIMNIELKNINGKKYIEVLTDKGVSFIISKEDLDAQLVK